MQPGELDGAGNGDTSPHARLDAFEFHSKMIRLRVLGSGLCRELKRFCRVSGVRSNEVAFSAE